MRIRSIRPEFWSSEDVAAMDWHARKRYSDQPGIEIHDIREDTE